MNVAMLHLTYAVYLASKTWNHAVSRIVPKFEFVRKFNKYM